MSWLRVWLDSQLKFTSHINKKIRKTQNAEIQIKNLTKMYRLASRLVCRIQLAVVQSTILYSAEFWQKGQKTMSKPFKKCSTNKRNQLQECTQVLFYIHYFVKQVQSLLQRFLITAKNNTLIDYSVFQISILPKIFYLLALKKEMEIFNQESYRKIT